MKGIVHWQQACMNPVTGRKVWLLRHIPTGVYGEPYDWSLVIIKPSWFSRTAEVCLSEGMSLSKRRVIHLALVEKSCFNSAAAWEKGKRVVWDFQGRRKIQKEK